MVQRVLRVLDAGYISDINDRADLTLVDRDIDVDTLKAEIYAIDKDAINLIAVGGFFVKVENGEYAEIYAFNGTVADLSKPIYKIEISDIIPGSPQWVKESLINKEINRINTLMETLIANNTLNDYDLEDDNKNFSRVIYNFDGYDYERITIQPIMLNGYGVIEYQLEITSYSESDEIETPEAICQDGDFTNHVSERKLKAIGKQADKEIQKWNNSDPISTYYAGSNQKLETYHTIEYRTCYNNITHEHPYKATTVLAYLREFDLIEPYIRVRDLLVNL